MNILILGGAGFIGKNLVCELLKISDSQITVIDSFINSDLKNFKELYPTIRIIDMDITLSDTFDKLVQEINPSEIFHLAANSDIRLSSIDPMHDLRNTFMTTSRLAGVLPLLDKPAVFFASSSAVYGPKNGPVDETSTPNPISSYGWMKYTSEILLADYLSQNYISKLVIFRFPNVVGQHMTHGVIFDLINKLRSNPEYLEVLGDGTQEKPYVLASDLAKNISESIFNEEFASGTYNISTKDRAKVSEIVEAICRLTASAPIIKYGTSRSGWNGDVAEYELNVEKINSSVLAPKFAPSAHAIENAVKFYWQEVQ